MRASARQQNSQHQHGGDSVRFHCLGDPFPFKVQAHVAARDSVRCPSSTNSKNQFTLQKKQFPVHLASEYPTITRLLFRSQAPPARFAAAQVAPDSVPRPRGSLLRQQNILSSTNAATTLASTPLQPDAAHAAVRLRPVAALAAAY